MVGRTTLLTSIIFFSLFVVVVVAAVQVQNESIPIFEQIFHLNYHFIHIPLFVSVSIHFANKIYFENKLLKKYNMYNNYKKKKKIQSEPPEICQIIIIYQNKYRSF